MRRSRRAALTVFAFAALLLTPSLTANAKDEPAPPPPVIEGADAAARVAHARELAVSDPDGLARALVALGEDADKTLKKDATARTVTLDFLSNYLVGEKGRFLRLLALDAAARLDKEGTAERLLGKLDSEDVLEVTFATDALGYVGDRKHVPRLLEVAEHVRPYVGVYAMRSIARLGKSKDADALIEFALTVGNTTVADHAAWAAQDLLKKQKTAIAKIKKAGGKDTRKPRGLRALSIVALMEDNAALPQNWKDQLPEVRELVEKIRPEVEVRASSARNSEPVKAALEWLADNMPASYLLVRASVDSIEVPLAVPQAWIDLKSDAVGVPISYTVQNDRQLAYHIVRVATVLFSKRTGHPFVRHRGWYDAVFDSFDQCYLAGLYNCGRSGVPRHAFIEQILEKRPWDGQME